MCAEIQENACPSLVYRMYRMEIMKYALTSFANLLILLVGVGIGLFVAPKVEKGVFAQQVSNAPPAPACVSSASVDCVTPIMTMGSAGIGKLIANQISTDHLTVNGYDVLKLEDSIMDVLINSRIITAEQAKALAEKSLADKQLRYQPPTPPPAPTPTPTPNK